MSGEDRVNAPALVSSGIVLGGILVLVAVVSGRSRRQGVAWRIPQVGRSILS